MLNQGITYLNEYRAGIHLALHVLVPLIIALIFTRGKVRKTAFILMMLTMLVDVDHLLATPIYAPNRCSILFHPLHQVWSFVLYGLMVLWPAILLVLKKQIRPFEKVVGWLGVGLLVHMMLDSVDCWWMRGL